MRRFRRLNHLWAWLKGYFWMACPICDEMFGGHEAAKRVFYVKADGRRLVCWRHDEEKHANAD